MQSQEVKQVHQSICIFQIIVCMCIYCLFSLNAVSQETNSQVEQALSDMLKIGDAIIRFEEERGVKLVDLIDDDSEIGQKRLHEEFENVGNPSDRPRTMLDVLQPLVHFGYLDVIPIDPFIPEDSDPDFNTYIYFDEESTININETKYQTDYFTLMLSLYVQMDEWVLISPGENKTYDRSRTRNLTVHKSQVISQPKNAEEYLQKSKENMMQIGRAIERLRTEKGVLLVDFWDDDSHLIQRIDDVFEGVEGGERTKNSVLKPLVHFGYLDEIPEDPFHPSLVFNSRTTWNEFLPDQPMTYLYCDNDPELEGGDAGTNWPDSFGFELEEGEWALIGYSPMVELPNDPLYYRPEVAFYILSRDFTTDVIGWDLY